MSIENLEIGGGIFTISDLSEILRIPKSRARYWFNTYVREELPAITNYRYNFNSDQGLYVNFKSLLQLYVFEELKKEGFQKKSILNAYSTLSQTLNTKYPFATNKILIAGKSILLELDNDHIIDANSTKQFNLVKVLTPYLRKIQFDTSGNAIRFYPLGKRNSIVVDPKVQFGTPVISGTRIDIRTIFDSYQAGDSKDLISKIYDLTVDQINDAIEFSIAA